MERVRDLVSSSTPAGAAWRVATGLAVVALGVAGVYWLMVWDVHFLLLAVFGAGCGASAGWSFAGRRGAAAGAVIGFIAPLVYLPLWFAFNLPPDTGIDL